MELSWEPDLSGKVAVVTGAGGVLCREFAAALSACGARVALLNRTLSKAEAVAESIRAEGGIAEAVQVDVCDKESLKNAHGQVLKLFGKCDILVNGAGGNHPSATTDCETFDQAVMDSPEKQSFFDLEESAFNHVFGLNIMGTVLPTQEFSRDMIGRGGNIINISSMNAYTPLTRIPAYSAAKAGVSNFTQWLAVHFATAGIRANAIAPGFFISEQNRKLFFAEDGSPSSRAKKILAGTPMGRFGEAQELLGTLLWLVDDKSSGFVTGIVVPVDGGFSAYSGV